MKLDQVDVQPGWVVTRQPRKEECFVRLELILNWDQAPAQNRFTEQLSCFVVYDSTECFLAVMISNYEGFLAEKPLRLLADPLCDRSLHFCCTEHNVIYFFICEFPDVLDVTDDLRIRLVHL